MRAALAVLLASVPGTCSAGMAVPRLAAPMLPAASMPAPALPLSPSLELSSPSGLPGSGFALPMLSAPAFIRPALSAASPAASHSGFSAPVGGLLAPAPAVRAAAPVVRGRTPVAAGLMRFDARRSEAARGGMRAAGLSSRFSGLFDGTGRFGRGVPAVSAESGKILGRETARRGEAWRHAAFLSPADGAVITYRERNAERSEGAPKVFVGGMGLPDSFESYFETGRAGDSAEYLLTLRGLPPTEWSRTRETFDSDAKDLARMIVLASRETGSGAVELVLHSYSTLVFQRMLQLAGDPGVDRALGLLRGSRVVFIGASTHYGDSETVAGPEYAEMAKQVRAFVNWIDAVDSYGEMLEKAAELNPFLRPQVDGWLMLWGMQRRAALSAASKPGAELLIEHLNEPWSPEIDHIRERILAQTRKVSRLPGWQEAMLRRANDTSLLEFTPGDVERMRELGVRLDVLHAAGDQLIPWVSERLLAEMLGIDAPEELPSPGTVLSDEDGLFRMIIVDGDHYFPLKRPDLLRRLLK